MGNYLKRISASKDEKALASAKTAAEHGKLDTEAFIGAKKKQLSTVNAASEAALSAQPFDIARVVSLGQEKAALQAEIATAEKVLADEFGAE